MRTKHFSLCCLVLLCSISTFAYDFQVENMYFNVLGGDSVEITNGTVKYSGDIVIPTSIVYSGNTYRVVKIGSSAFKSCTDLNTVNIPSCINEIGGSAFYGCSYLSSVTIKEGVKAIQGSAFAGCSLLQKISIPNSVITFGGSVFSGCSYLTTVSLGKNMSSLPQTTFKGCKRLSKVYWNIKRISDYGDGGSAFHDQDEVVPIKTIEFGPDVEYIPAKLFYIPAYTSLPDFYKHPLTTVIIHAGLQEIGKWAFYSAGNITQTTIVGDPNAWGAIQFKDLYSNPVRITGKLYCNGEIVTKISIPEGVQKISAYAFCSPSLTSIVIPSSVETIETTAFSGCSSIKDVSILAQYPPSSAGGLSTSLTIKVPCGVESAYTQHSVWKNYNIESSIFHTFSAKTADPLMGAVDVTQFPDCSTNGIAKFVATPEDGYHFVSWNDGSTTNPRTVEVTEDLAFIATFAQDVQVTGLSLDQSTLTIQPGESYTLVPTISPADATNQNIIWTSSNANIAYVYNGTVTGLANGRAVITAETEDGHFTASCIVTVADPVSVTGITLSETSVNMQIGDTHQLTATVLPADAANKNYTWKTDDATIATVENGLITAVNYGKTTITATTEDGGKTATCEVEVGVPVAGITLDQTEIIIAPGASKKLTATIEPDNATNKNFTWTSSDENVAAVANGWVIGVAEGTATITATTEDGGFVATCQVTVGIPVTGITLNETSLVLMPGNTKQLFVTIEPANASNQNYTLTSDNEDVALITSAGWLVANNVGTANITATSEDGGYTAICAVTVQTTISTDIEYQDVQDISVHKVFENGTIYILRNGEKYMIDGRKVM